MSLGIGITPAASLHIYGSDARLRIQDDDHASAYFEIDVASQNQTVIGAIANTGISAFIIDPKPLDGTSIAQIGIFRLTDTTGEKQLILYKGDGTGTIDVQIGVGGQTTYFNGGGNFGIKTAVPLSPLHIGLATEDFEVVDAGSAAATEQDWIEVEIGGVQGYIRVYAAK